MGVIVGIKLNNLIHTLKSKGEEKVKEKRVFNYIYIYMRTSCIQAY